MIPPTLTPFPTRGPEQIPFDMPNISLWEFAPEAVQAWHSAGTNWTMMIQAALLLMLIIAAIFALIRMAKKVSEVDDRNPSEKYPL